MYNLEENMNKFKKKNVRLPKYDVKELILQTSLEPEWIHFGAGDIFRGFLSVLQQNLLEKNESKTGIILAEAFDLEVIDKIYDKFENIIINITVDKEGNFNKEIIGSVTHALKCDNNIESDWKFLKRIFMSSTLKMVSLTIADKCYSLYDENGKFREDILYDVTHGNIFPASLIGKLTYFLHLRFKVSLPIALVSMDNLENNGYILKDAVKTLATMWRNKGFVESEFVDYICDENKVSFPLTVIDKIVPKLSESIKEHLISEGFEDIDILHTENGTYIAPFVNSEKNQCLLIEDIFPNGKIPLDKVGVCYTDKDTIKNFKKSKHKM